MSNKNIYEVFNDFTNVKTKQERLDILRRNDTWALKNILQAVFHPDVKFSIKVPEWRKVEVPPGMSYDHMTSALQRVYLFQDGHPRCPPALTDERKSHLLIQILESLEPKEAEVFANMLRKDLKVPYLTQALVNEAFPGLLPQP